MWGKMDDCVNQVKAKGKGKNAYAICYSSIMGSDISNAAKQRMKQKGGK
jgi:hypothetical protein